MKSRLLCNRNLGANRNRNAEAKPSAQLGFRGSENGHGAPSYDGRDAKKMESFVKRGAVAFVGNIEDAASMTEAFNSASAVYLVLPEDISQQDLRATDAWHTSQRH